MYYCSILAFWVRVVPRAHRAVDAPLVVLICLQIWVCLHVHAWERFLLTSPLYHALAPLRVQWCMFLQERVVAEIYTLAMTERNQQALCQVCECVCVFVCVCVCVYVCVCVCVCVCVIEKPDYGQITWISSVVWRKIV